MVRWQLQSALRFWSPYVQKSQFVTRAQTRTFKASPSSVSVSFARSSGSSCYTSEQGCCSTNDKSVDSSECTSSGHKTCCRNYIHHNITRGSKGYRCDRWTLSSRNGSASRLCHIADTNNSIYSTQISRIVSPQLNSLPNFSMSPRRRERTSSFGCVASLTETPSSSISAAVAVAAAATPSPPSLQSLLKRHAKTCFPNRAESSFAVSCSSLQEQCQHQSQGEQTLQQPFQQEREQLLGQRSATACPAVHASVDCQAAGSLHSDDKFSQTEGFFSESSSNLERTRHIYYNSCVSPSFFASTLSRDDNTTFSAVTQQPVTSPAKASQIYRPQPASIIPALIASTVLRTCIPDAAAAHASTRSSTKAASSSAGAASAATAPTATAAAPTRASSSSRDSGGGVGANKRRSTNSSHWFAAGVHSRFSRWPRMPSSRSFRHQQLQPHFYQQTPQLNHNSGGWWTPGDDWLKRASSLLGGSSSSISGNVGGGGLKRRDELQRRLQRWKEQQQQRMQQQQQLWQRTRHRLLRMQRQQLLLLLQQQQQLKEKSLLWLDLRKKRIEAKLAYHLQNSVSTKYLRHKQLQNIRSHMITGGQKAKERLKGLWERYGWASVLAYAVVHVLTFLGLFGLAQTVTDESIEKITAILHLDKIFDNSQMPSSDEKYRGAMWGRLLFAYAACKPLTPIQVGLAIWATPRLARFLLRRGIPLHFQRNSIQTLYGRVKSHRKREDYSSKKGNTL